MGGDSGLANKREGCQAEHDPGLTQSSLDKDVDTQDASDTQFSSISTPSDKLPNGPPPQEKPVPEAHQFEHQKSRGMIALIMSALCVRRPKRSLNMFVANS